MGMAKFEAVQRPETRAIRERIRARLAGARPVAARPFPMRSR